MAGTLDETVDFTLETMFPTVVGLEALGLRLARRLETPRGWFEGHPDDGTDLRQYLLDHATPSEIAAAAVAECRKDEQVEYVRATVTVLDEGKRIQLALAVLATSGGSAVFTLTATAAAVSLVSLQAA